MQFADEHTPRDETLAHCIGLPAFSVPAHFSDQLAIDAGGCYRWPVVTPAATSTDATSAWSFFGP